MAGAAIVAGVALLATGVGGPLGLALVGAGADTIIQKATTGEVDWGRVALTGAVGIIAGPLAGKVSSAVASGLGRAGTALSTRALPAAVRAGSAAVSGAGRAGAVVSGVGSRVGTAVVSGASRAGSAFASAGSRAGTAVASGVSRVSSSAGGYVTGLPGQQMLRSAVTNGVSGGVTNTGMYALTTPQDDWSLRGVGSAAVGGAVTGVVSSQAGHLAAAGPSRLAQLTQYGVASGGAVAGGAVDHALTNRSYDLGEMVVDGVGGGVLSHFPAASALSPSPGWLDHTFAAYGGAHASAIVGSIKFIGAEVMP